MLESNLTAAMVKKLKTVKGFWVYKTAGGFGTRSGVPDLLACYRGHFLALENKVKGNQPTELQLRELESIKAAGGRTVVPYSVEEAMDFLNAIHPIELMERR